MIWVWVIALLLIVSAWATVLLMKWAWWIAAAVTALFLVVIGGVYLFRHLRAARRAAALEQELLRQAAQQAEHARPERRMEILQLQTRMKEAIQALKRSKLGNKGGRSALYSLPWYAIVGPSAAGKTTALEQSGLSFISPGGGSPKLRGTAGTKNCDWWFGRDAILLDTAGRFATEEDDQDEWFAFLDTIKKFRGERPLDGILLAVSIADIVGSGEAQIEELATKLRTRIEELMTRLEMVLPVYVLFTKADLIAGFVEFWSDLGKQNRGQVWGATFPVLEGELPDPATLFQDEFDLLTDSLHARVVQRLPQERGPEARARVLQFPVEFRAARAPLTRFFEELCQVNPYQDAPILRGFYFTSGTQVGRPMDRVLANMLQGFGVSSKGRSFGGEKPQSYFVTDVFQTVVFPDRHLALTSTSRVRRGMRYQIVAAVIAVLGTLLVVIPGLVSYLDNTDLVRDTRRRIDEVSAQHTDDARAAMATTLDPLLQQVKTLEESRDQFHVYSWWGPYAASSLYEPVRAFYVTRLRTVIEGPVREQLTADVRAIGDLVRTDSENFRGSYEELKLYVMLTSPDHLDPAWAAPQLAEAWARAFHQDGDAEKASLAVHARYYVDAMAADHSLAWHADQNALGPARSRLSRQPIEELQYRWLLANARGVGPIRPEHIFVGSAASFATTRGGTVEVPGAYTKAGWDKIHVALGSDDSQLVLEPWVFGDETRAVTDSKRAGADRLENIYFQRYLRAWSDFLGGLVVQTPTNVQGAIDELRVLADAEGPYVRLFRAIAENSKLEMESPLLGKGKELLAGAGAKVGAKDKDGGVLERKVSPVEKQLEPLVRFGYGAPSPAGGAAPSALGQYLAQLTTLEVSLGQLLESKSEPTAMFQDDLARTTAVVERLLGGLEPATRILLEPLLMNPIRGSRAGVAGTASLALSDKWKAEVWEAYDQKIAPRYPFAEASDDVAITEFIEFFRPQTGTIWKFYEKNLPDRLERSGNTFSVKASSDPIPFMPDFIRCLNTAAEITDAFFGTAQEAAILFSVKLESESSHVAEVTLTIDGEPIVYRNEPERWFPSHWPGKGASKGGILQVKGAAFQDEIPRAGDFGMFRLLAAGDLKPLQQSHESGPVYQAVFSLNRPGEPPIRVSIKPSKTSHPFARDFFRRLRCPAIVVAGGPPPGVHPAP